MKAPAHYNPPPMFGLRRPVTSFPKWAQMLVSRLARPACIIASEDEPL